MSLNEGLDPELKKKLAFLQHTPPRTSEKAALGKAAFLAQAQALAGAVSKSVERRPNGWIQALQSIFAVPRKEHSPMFSPLATILIAISLVLGGGGLTIAGAQSSQPDQPLYGVKLLSEEARLQIAANTETVLQLRLEFTDRRAAEIKAIFQNGKVPSGIVQNRYQNQVEQTMRLAVNMPDPQAVQALEEVRLHLQNQQQAFLKLNPNANPQAEAALSALQQMIQQHLQWIAEGIADPAVLRLRLQQQQNQNPGGIGGPGNPGMGGGSPMHTGTLIPGSGYGPGPGAGGCSSCTPNTGGMMGNPWTTGTPSPGSGYGPGPGPMPTQTMGGGSGNGMGPGPMPYQTPGSGPGMGPGPQPTSGMGGGMHH